MLMLVGPFPFNEIHRFWTHNAVHHPTDRDDGDAPGHGMERHGLRALLRPAPHGPSATLSRSLLSYLRQAPAHTHSLSLTHTHPVPYTDQTPQIIGSTGPVLAFTLVLYRTAQSLGLSFLPLYSWVGIWTSLILFVSSITSFSNLVNYFTRFTDEIFSLLISVIFLFEGASRPPVPSAWHPPNLVSRGSIRCMAHPTSSPQHHHHHDHSL